jgi:hypothetical protein
VRDAGGAAHQRCAPHELAAAGADQAGGAAAQVADLDGTLDDARQRAVAVSSVSQRVPAHGGDAAATAGAEAPAVVAAPQAANGLATASGGAGAQRGPPAGGRVASLEHDVGDAAAGPALAHHEHAAVERAGLEARGAGEGAAQLDRAGAGVDDGADGEVVGPAQRGEGAGARRPDADRAAAVATTTFEPRTGGATPAGSSSAPARRPARAGEGDGGPAGSTVGAGC